MKRIELGSEELELLTKTASLVRDLSAERDKIAKELTEFKRTKLASEIVANLEPKGLSDSAVPFLTRVQALLNSDKDLEIVKEAAAMSSPDMSFGSVAEGYGSDELNSEQAFYDYLTS